MWWRRGRDKQGRNEPAEEHSTAPVSAASLAADLLAVETEAFLSGRLAEHYIDRGVEVPAWAWLNAVAHRNDAELAAMVLAGRPERVPLALGRWYDARLTLAVVVLDIARYSREDITELQQEALIPLEIGLAGAPLEPQVLVERAVDALHRGVFGAPD
jgi:hypothetical protein